MQLMIDPLELSRFIFVRLILFHSNPATHSVLNVLILVPTSQLLPFATNL